jgi:hypothetical protein
MKAKFFIIILISLFFSCSNQTPKVASPQTPLQDPEESEAKILKDYGPEKLGEALNIMRVVLDRPQAKPNSEFCELTSEQASLMSQQLRFLIEEKISTLGKPKNPPLIWRECKQTCSCYVYSRVYGGENEYFENATKSITTKEAYECSKRSNWYCDSSLHQYLKSLSSMGEAKY